MPLVYFEYAWRKDVLWVLEVCPDLKYAYLSLYDARSTHIATLSMN